MSIAILKQKASNSVVTGISEKEEGRKEFVQRFPLDKIHELELDQFVVGGSNRDSFFTGWNSRYTWNWWIILQNLEFINRKKRLRPDLETRKYFTECFSEEI